MGAHAIKVGLGPLIVDLIARRRIAAVAMNGACLVHDFELAATGRTSEDVGPGLDEGLFGMARETGAFLNRTTTAAAVTGLGLGAGVGEAMVRAQLRFADTSVLVAASRAGIPATVHVAVGTDIIHMHPSADGAAIGATSLRDFRLLAAVAARLEGGVYLNLGSAVVLPEVFVKALNLARNLGHRVRRFTTVDMDFMRHYRPGVNVVTRPTAGGRRRPPADGASRDHVPAPLGGGRGRAPPAVMRLVTLTTDFGTTDPFVGIMKGVIAGRAPDVRVVDVTHGIPPQDVTAGALVLRHAVPYFPPGTMHVAVVDPGVGGPRRALCIETATAILLGPDNGLLSLVDQAVHRIVHVTESRFFLPNPSRTFHGRDVFAPVAAALATGTPADALGPAVADMERIVLPEPVVESTRVRGQVIYVDGFGNLVTNVPGDAVAAPCSVCIGGRRIPGLAPAYSAVPTGTTVAVVGSWGLVEIAVRDGSARATLGVGTGEPVVIETG